MISYTTLLVFWWLCSAIIFAVVGLRVWILVRTEPVRRYLFSLASLKDVFLLLTAVAILVSDVIGTHMLTTIHRAEERVARENPQVPEAMREFYLTMEEIVGIYKWSYISYLVVTIALWATKATLSAIYLNLFPSLSRWLRVLVVGTAVYLALTLIATLGLLLFYCGSPATNWAIQPLSVVSSGGCIAILELPPYIIYAVFSVSADIALLFTGLLVIRSLQLYRRRQLIAIAFISVIGVLSMVASLFRCILMSRFIIRGTVVNSSSLANVKLSSFWVSIESCAAVLACTLPTLRALLYRGGMGTSGTGSSGSGSGMGRGVGEKRTGFVKERDVEFQTLTENVYKP